MTSHLNLDITGEEIQIMSQHCFFKLNGDNIASQQSIFLHVIDADPPVPLNVHIVKITAAQRKKQNPLLD